MITIGNPLRRYFHPLPERAQNPSRAVTWIAVAGVTAVVGFFTWRHFHAPAAAADTGDGGEQSLGTLPADSAPARTADNDTQRQSGSYGRFAWEIYGRPGYVPYWTWRVKEIDGVEEHMDQVNTYAAAQNALVDWLTEFGA